MAMTPMADRIDKQQIIKTIKITQINKKDTNWGMGPFTQNKTNKMPKAVKMVLISFPRRLE